MNEVEYTEGDALPSTPVTWRENGAVQDFTTGWTLSLRVAKVEGDPAIFTKTTGFSTTFPSVPNITIDWANADLATLAPGRYVAKLRATHSSTRKQTLKFGIVIVEDIA